jgi:hypothetical protein
VSFPGSITPGEPITAAGQAGGEADEAAVLRPRPLVSLLTAVPVVVPKMVPGLQITGWQWLSLALAEQTQPFPAGRQHRLAAGDFAAQMPPAGFGPEPGTLTGAFNSMATAQAPQPPADAQNGAVSRREARRGTAGVIAWTLRSCATGGAHGPARGAPSRGQRPPGRAAAQPPRGCALIPGWGKDLCQRKAGPKPIPGRGICGQHRQ